MWTKTSPVKLLQVAFVGVALGLVAISALLGYPAHQDEVFFKSAGLHWSMDGEWRAPEEENYAGWTPPLHEVFASYPPLYPFLFGLLVKLAGFSQTTANLYDGIIHVLLALTLVVFARRALPQAPVVGWLIGLLWLLIGYPARPDRLAMVGGFAALAFAVSPRMDRPRWLDLAAGMAFGLCVATSVPAAVAFGPLLAGLCLGPGIRRAWQRLMWIGLTALVVAALICLPVYLYDFRALEQNIDATVRITHALGFLDGLQHLIRLNPATVLCSVLLVCAALWLGRPTSRSADEWMGWIRWSLVPMVPLAFFLSKSSFQANYHWFLIPWFAVALFSPDRPTPPLVLRSCILIAAFFLPMLYAQRTTVSAVVTGGDQKVRRYQATVESIIPEDAVVMARDYWWLLGTRNRVLDPMVWTTADTRPDFVVLTGYGSGRLARPNAIAPEQLSRDYEIVSDQLGRAAPTLLGLPVSRSTFSAGPIVYRRKAPLD